MKNFILAIVLLLVSMTAFSQGIPLSTNFTVNTGLPIDDRMSMPNTAARDAIPALRRWQGMLIYVVDIGKHFTLIGGIDNANWTELSGSGGGIAEFQPTTEYKEKDVVFEVNRIYYANADFTSGASFNPSDWTELSPVDLTLASGQLPVANGTNFVNKTTAESVAGDKTFTGETTFNNRVTMTDMINIDRPEGIVKTDNTGNIEVGKIDLTDEVEKSLPQNNGGNGNLIPTNASFELSPVNTDWTCSAIVPSASSAAAVDGAQGITFTASATNQGCTRYVSMPEGNVGKLLEYSMYVKSTGGDVEVCSINDSVVSNCKTYTVGQSTDVVKVIVTDRPKNANTNANGILFRTKTATSTTFFGDLAYVGLPKSDEAIVAKFDNTTNKVPCTFSTLSWVGFGTVTTNNITCRRDRYHLVLEGNFVATGVTGSIVEIPMPTNYGTITIADTTSTNLLIGAYIKGVTSTEHGGGVAINTTIKNNAIYLTDGSVFGSASINGTDRATGTRVGGTISFVGEIKIPIAEWSSQTNAAIVGCRESDKRKCVNTLSFTYLSGASTATDQFGFTYPVTRSGTNNSTKTFNVSSLGLANNMICPSSVYIDSGAGYTTKLVGTDTNTAFSINTIRFDQVAYDGGIQVSCTKQGSDYNEAYEKIVIQKDNADIRSTEWLTGGFDYIDNKPIYKRCHKVSSTVAAGTTTITTWPASLQPVDTLKTGSLFYLKHWSDAGNVAEVWYNSTSGALVFKGVNRTLDATQTVCMEYTK